MIEIPKDARIKIIFMFTIVCNIQKVMEEKIWQQEK